MGLFFFAFFYFFYLGLFLIWWISSTEHEKRGLVGIASRRSGVACRRKRHRSNGGGSNAVGSNAIATATPWQRQWQEITD